ncbi:MAG: NfeD family protein [Ignavibacteriales bacterium]|nr:NfeD family protein [Ignavibacteriales bacterium]MCF8305732.1 NfeD family protein [Ignavibacteriales bacterium]MCF8315454.1 NfeD family protein [Ignavibacteriales bacterium]MCF8437018.1 NfeD family protein [Ignavibacteriales bacterium]
MESDLIRWYTWILISLVLFIFEIFAPGFILASLGIGAIVAGIVASTGLSLIWQILFFALGSFAAFLGIKPFYNRFLKKFDEDRITGIRGYIGKTCVVTERVAGSYSPGRVKVMGETWKAVCAEGSVFEEGESAVIEKVEDLTLFINK